MQTNVSEQIVLNAYEKIEQEDREWWTDMILDRVVKEYL